MSPCYHTLHNANFHRQFIIHKRKWEHYVTSDCLHCPHENLQNLQFFVFKCFFSHCFVGCCSQSVYSQTAKKKTTSLFISLWDEIIHFIILRGVFPLRHKVLYKAALNELCSMKRCGCLLECLIFISLKNWMDFCFVTDFRVLFSFSVCLPVFRLKVIASASARGMCPLHRDLPAELQVKGQRSSQLCH